MLVAHKICRACGRAFAGVEIFCPDDGSRLHVVAPGDSPSADPLIGTTLDGRYRVIRVLGEGGMGIVYEAQHVAIERRVAVKVLREDFSRRPDVVERFRREAKSASRIGHPNIVDVLDFGQTHEGASYFVMELLEGADLADILAREVRISPSRAVAMAVQCCRALAAAHAKGIVHRDLKPENIFIVERGGYPDFVKLVDFGVAKMSELEDAPGGLRKLTRTGMIFGTPEYMSPEQANGQSLDHRVDVYALGVILYEALTGRVPFEGESFMAVLSKHATVAVPALREMCPSLRISAELENVVMTALTKKRDGRYPHMRAMCEALELVPEMPDGVPRDSLVTIARSSAPSVPGTLPAAAPVPDGAAPRIATEEEAVAFRGPSVVTQVRRFVRESPRRTAAIAAVAAASLLAGGALAVLSARSTLTATGAPSHALPPAASTLSEAASVGLPSSPQAVDSTANAADAQPVADAARRAAPRELVPVRVASRPAGARVTLADGAEVCDATPCTIDAARGELLSIVVTKGALRASAQLQPQDGAEVSLVLDRKRQRVAATKRPMPEEATDDESPLAPAPQPVASAPYEDDLKVPAEFR